MRGNVTKLIYLALALTLTASAACSSSTPAHKEEKHGHDGPRHGHRFTEPDELAKRWNDPERDAWQKPSEVVGMMGLEPGMTAVDLGSWTGYFVPYLAAEVAPDGKVLALDVEESMVAYLEQRKKEKGWSFVEPTLVAYDDPKLAKQSVDRVLTVNTWHHIEDREAYAQKLAEALETGGSVWIVDYEPGWEGGGPPPEMRLESAQVARELAAAGLQSEVLEESLPRHYVVVGRKE